MGKINKKITKTPPKKILSNKFKCELIEESNKIKDEQNNNEKTLTEDKLQGTINNVKEKQAKDEPKEFPAIAKSKKNKKNDNRFYSRVARSRKEKGMAILPVKVENKIYRLKVALRKKGMDGEEIRDIIRKKRRQEELRLRNEMENLCFKCRQPGHSLANCPQASQTDSSNICYCCGSSEHRLCDCPKYKSNGKNENNLPYATCFICKKSGHLTRSCKQNENGVFPKGGKCILCGSIKHLAKDCSQNKDKFKDKEIILKTYNNMDQGVDVDDFEIISKVEKKNTTKLIKF